MTSYDYQSAMTTPYNKTVLQRSYETQNSEIRFKYNTEPKLYAFSLWLMLIPMGFDFKDRGVLTNSIYLQVLIFGLSFTGFLISIWSYSNFNTKKLNLLKTKSYLALWAAYFSYIFVISVFRSGEIVSIARSMSSQIAFAIGMIASILHVQSNYDPAHLFRRIFYTCMISLFWTYYLGQFTSANYNDNDFSYIEDVRYAVISPALPLLAAWALYHIIRGHRVMLYSIVIILVTFVSVVSKTRGLLAGYLVLIPFVILISSNKVFALVKFLQLSIVAFIFAILLPQIYLEYDFIAIWEFRVFGNEYTAFDVTLYTRLAEYMGQMNMLFQDPISALFGFGIATVSYWDPVITDLIDRTFNNDTFYYYTIGVGTHSTYINALFHGGLIAGWIPTFSFGIIGWISIRFILLKKTEQAKFADEFKAALSMIIVIIGPMAFGNLFTDRVNCMMIGIVSIYIVSEWEKWRFQLGQFMYDKIISA